ncbi:MAG: hypothetical protein ACT4PT_14095 [Methanobacteriota archaeon]
MWHVLTKYFQRYPAQARVAQLLLRYGLAVRDDGVYCDTISIPDTSLARAARVDRRVISATVRTIQNEPELRDIYSRLLPTAHLKDVAPAMKWGVIEIIPNDAHQPGILAGVATVIADRNISIRQAVVDDPEFMEEPRLFIITESPIPADVLPAIKDAPGVKSVVIY